MNLTVTAETNTNTVNDENIIEYIDTELNSLIEDKLTVGITASIVKNNEVVLSKGYGYADEKNGVMVNPDNSTFRIGSVSKTFVAFAAMQLVEQDKLDMNKPITEYIPHNLLDLKYPVTMKDLLTHTAGFEDQVTLDTARNSEEVIPLDDYVKNNMPNQVFQPGVVSAYSNYGYALAGYVIEKISGMSFYDYAEQYIFEPLEMDNTTFKTTPKGTISKSYYSNDEKTDLESNDYPAGSITTTAQDMTKYMLFLLNENNQSILSNKSKNEVFQKNFAMDNEFPGIGFAWQRHSMNEHIFYTHDGGLGNFTSTIAIFPEEQMGLFISCNQTGDFALEEYIYNVSVKLYGVDKAMATYHGEINRDISGWYISARSSFKGSDKFANYFSGNLFKHITGNPKDGFEVNGEKLTPVGEDAYQIKPGEYIKFMQKGEQLFYAPSQYYTSYVHVPWYEGETWQMTVLALFFIISMLGFILSIIRLILNIKNKKDKYIILTNLPMIAVFVLFISILIRIILQLNHITEVYGANVSLDLEKVIAFIKLIAAMLTFSGVCGIVSTVYLWLKKQNILIKIFYTVWCIAFVLFLSLLIQMNLLG
jgi:CubicO group peptidase (beta-lactamase class C family)